MKLYNPKTKVMKKFSVLMMSIMIVGAVAFTSCGSKETKATDETTKECCEKKDSTCCEKKDSCAKHCEKADSTACNKPCEGNK